MVIPERRELGAVDHPDAHIGQKIHHPELPAIEANGNRRLAGARVRRAQRMIAALGPRHDRVGFSGERQEMAQQARGDKGHVAGHEKQRVVARRGERGVEAAQGAAPGHAIPHQPEIGSRRRRLLPNHEHHIVGDLRQLLDLAVEDGAVRRPRAPLVAAAEAARPSAGEDCRACHRASILSCGA